MKIYVASSWRNAYQPTAVAALRSAGFEVYDFRNPRPGDHGFAWSDIDPDWKNWTTDQYAEALTHPVAAAGFKSDMDALTGCDAVVLVLPCGRSAHLEAGHAAGAGRGLYVWSLEPCEPELMYLMGSGVFSDIERLAAAIKR